MDPLHQHFFFFKYSFCWKYFSLDSSDEDFTGNPEESEVGCYEFEPYHICITVATGIHVKNKQTKKTGTASKGFLYWSEGGNPTFGRVPTGTVKMSKGLLHREKVSIIGKYWIE